jgi:hypothetical protein
LSSSFLSALRRSVSFNVLGVLFDLVDSEEESGLEEFEATEFSFFTSSGTVTIEAGSDDFCDGPEEDSSVKLIFFLMPAPQRHFED